MGQRLIKLANLIVLTSGLILSILALTVMTGWLLRSTAIVQISESYVPMQFNTAFCFFLLGMGCLGTYFQIRSIIIGSGLLALFISGTTLFQYLSGTSFGVDQLFFTYNLSVQTDYPGRMALNTSVCFVLSAIILLLIFQRDNKRVIVARQIISSLIIMISGLKLYGYISGVESALVWMDINRMALHTALGFFLFGATIFSIETMRSLAVEKIYLSGSVCMASILIFLSVCIIYTYDIQKDKQSEERSRQYIANLVNLVENEFSLYMEILQQLAFLQKGSQKDASEVLTKSFHALNEDVPFIISIKYLSGSAKTPPENPRGVMFQKGNSPIYEVQLPVFGSDSEDAGKIKGYIFTEIDIPEMIQYYFKGSVKSEKMYWELYNEDGELLTKKLDIDAKSEFSRGITRNFRLLNQNFPFHLYLRSTAFGFSIDNVALILLLGSFSFLSLMVVYFAQRLYQEKVALQTTISKLVQAKYQAEQASIAKTSFLSNLSHEIRTPLNGIICGITLIHNSNLDEKQKRYLDRVEYCGNILLNIINDTLDISKIESGRLQLDPQPTNIRKTILSLYDVMNQNASERGIQLTLDSSFSHDMIVSIDDLRLKQILQNLLSNAIKFTEEGSVTFSARYEDTKDDTIIAYFEVSDTGIGIKEDALDKIFDKFNQADNSTTRKYGGTGLGLAICKQLVELYQGEIGVRSEFGKGSLFWVKLPFKKGGEKHET